LFVISTFQPGDFSLVSQSQDENLTDPTDLAVDEYVMEQARARKEIGAPLVNEVSSKLSECIGNLLTLDRSRGGTH
jgi:hypothetical protein